MWPVIKPKYSAGKRALNLENRRIYQITPYTLQSGKPKVRIRFSIPENPLVPSFVVPGSLVVMGRAEMRKLGTSHLARTCTGCFAHAHALVKGCQCRIQLGVVI